MHKDLSLSPDQHALLRKWLPLAHKLARAQARRAATRINEDEFETAAMLGLIHAAQLFDASRGVRFSTFVHKCISNRLKHVWKHYWTQREQFQHKFQAIGERKISGQRFDPAALDELPADWMDVLDEREQLMVRLRAADMTFEDIAKLMRMSKQCACQILQRAQARLEARLLISQQQLDDEIDERLKRYRAQVAA